MVKKEILKNVVRELTDDEKKIQAEMLLWQKRIRTLRNLIYP